MKIETILVATDFSESADRAVQTAVEFAKKFGAKLVVLHAYRVEIPMASPMMAGGYVLPDGFFEQLGKHAKEQVEKAADDRVTGATVNGTGALVIRAERAGLCVREIPIRVLEKRPPTVGLVKRIPNVLKNLAKLFIAIRIKR